MTRRRRRTLVALGVAATAFGCLKGTAPTSTSASDVEFDLSAQVSGGSSLGVTVDYLDQGNTGVQLIHQTLAVSGATQSLPLTIDLSRCLADPNHVSAGSTCELLVTVLLSEGGTVVDSTTVGPVVVTPGQVVHATTSVAAVGRIDVYPTTVSLTPGAITVLHDTVFAANGAILSNAPVTWTSADTTIARVNANGAVTGVSAGATHVTASSGGDSAQAAVVVSAPGGVGLVLTPSAISFSAPSGGTIPTNAYIPVTTADTTVATGLTASITYGSGGQTGWLVAYVSDSGFGSRVTKAPTGIQMARVRQSIVGRPEGSGVVTPATLDVVPNTSSLPAGTYTATVTVTGTNATPVNLSVTYTISTAAPALVLSPDTVTFEQYGGGTILPAAQTITASQTGLTVTSVTYYGLAVSWLSASQPAADTFSLNLSTTNLPLGTLQGVAHVQDTNGDTASVVVNVNVSATFTKLVAGGNFSCGLTTGATVYCWGDNSLGQLGTGSGTGPYAQPVPVPIPNAGLNGTPVSDITAGSGTACALMNTNAVWCWGYNPDGETGTGTESSPVFSPVAISGFDASQVSVGGYSTCAIGYPTVAPYGAQMSCWGANNYGQLGIGSTGSSQDTPVATAQTFVSVSTGFEHACAILDSNAPVAYCWGLNQYGQIGIDSTGADYPTPHAINGFSFASVSAAGYHTCAITTGSVPYCWGENTFGELGMGTIGGNEYTPIAVAGSLTLTQIAAGYYHTCGLTNGGTAYCWGYDSAGALGNGQTTGKVGTPTVVSGGLAFASIAPSVAGYHTCGLTTGGIAYCWGYDGFGQLGIASTQSSGVPVQVVGQPAAAGLSPGGGARVVKRPKATARPQARKQTRRSIPAS